MHIFYFISLPNFRILLEQLNICQFQQRLKLETTICLWIAGRVPQTGECVCMCVCVCLDYKKSASNWRERERECVCGLQVECLKLETAVSVWNTCRVPQTGVCVCVCVCACGLQEECLKLERERESVCVCVCVCGIQVECLKLERERESVCVWITSRVPQTVERERDSGLPEECLKLQTNISVWINGRVPQTWDNWLCVDYQKSVSNCRQMDLLGLPVEYL